MRFALCNEVLRDWPFERQCAFAAELGYDALEIAPFTLGPEPHRLDRAARSALRRQAEESGLAITGLHWLLVTPEGLSVTSADPAVRARTGAVVRGLIELCADLGGRYLVHGSPAQRALAPGREEEGRARAAELFAQAAEAAGRAGVLYCLEPLAPAETAYLTSVAEAAEVVRRIGHPALRTMIDCSAAARAEAAPIPELVRDWLPTGLIGHIHANDPNRRGPGEGDLAFGPILGALREQGYDGTVGVEPFIYRPDGPATAARAIGYLRGCLEAGRR
jgi:D-psicose/D-tagatose/L-ribulose 3-epimerase